MKRLYVQGLIKPDVTVTDLLSLLQPLKLHCDLCSIVSSSGQMLGQAAGPQIDRSPCIWRMNNAPTRGFENDVGRRTTLRVVSHTSVPLLLQKPQYFFGQGNDTVYVVWGPLRNMRKDGKGIVYNMLRQASENYPHARIYVTTEDRMNYCDMVFKKETGKDRWVEPQSSIFVCSCLLLAQPHYIPLQTSNLSILINFPLSTLTFTVLLAAIISALSMLMVCSMLCAFLVKSSLSWGVIKESFLTLHGSGGHFQKRSFYGSLWSMHCLRYRHQPNAGLGKIQLMR